MAKKEIGGLDIKVLMELAEPLTLYMERIVGSSTEPVALPALGDDRNIDFNGTPGTGWRRDDVVKLVPWVQDVWTGAGTYRVQVVDLNKKVHEFEFQIRQDERVKQRSAPPLSQKVPPPGAIQNVQMQPAPTPTPTMSVQPPPPVGMQPWGGPQQSPMQGPWAPPPQQPPQNPWAQQPPPQQAFQQAFQQPGYAPPPGYGAGPYGQPGYAPQHPYGQMQPWNPYAPPMPWGTPPGATPSRENENDKALKALQAEVEAGKRREIELKYTQDLDRTRAEHQKQIDSLREEMRRSNEQGANKENDEIRRAREDRERMEREREREETNRRFSDLQAAILKMGEAKRPSEDDDRFRKMEEENRRRDEAHQRELERRDQAAREERIRQEIKESNEKHERTLREIQASSNKGPDPMIEFMKESARETRASNERIAQMEARRLDAMSANSINPLQLVSILDKRDSSGDQFIRNMMPALTGVIELYKGAAENVVGLAGGGPAAAWQPIAEQVISTGKEVMDRYYGWKRDAEVSGNKAKIAQAEAQAQAANAAAAAQAAVASMQNRAQAPNGAQFTTASGHVGPTNGAAQPANGAGLGGAAAPAAAPPQSNVVPIRQPPGEAERFGPALAEVQKMRLLVKQGKMTPEQVVDSILKAVNFLAVHNAEHPPGDPQHAIIPVFTLFNEERWADFIDQVLPNAPVPFKQECVNHLNDTEPDNGQPSVAKDPDLVV